MSDFIKSLRVPAQLMALTPRGITAITGLTLRPIADYTDLPTAQGIYVWAASADGPVFYIGSAAGGKGLAGRVGNELRWGKEYLEWHEAGDPLDTGAAGEVPLVRIAADIGLTAFVAEAEPASWTVGDANLQLPATPQEWERFIQEAQSLVTGHRSLVGGGAWENRAGSLGDRMQAVAFARLRAMRAAHS